MSKKYKSMTDMIRNVSEDDQFKDDMLSDLSRRSVSRFLFTLRCEHNLTQKQLAHKLGCSQSRISKIERSYDEDISIKDMLDYGVAFNQKLEIGYRNMNAKIVDLIKYHAFKIKGYLDTLTNFAQKDDKISEGVFEFQFECLTNMFKMVIDSMAKNECFKRKLLPKEKTQVHISPSLNMIFSKRTDLSQDQKNINQDSVKD